MTLTRSFTRRRLIASLFSAAAVLPLASLLPLPARAAAGPAAAPRAGFYLVNGWILTADDISALGIEGAGTRL